MIVIHQLIWDEWNVGHISRHGVSPEEVEEMCRGEHIALQSYGGRLMLLGMARSRILAAVLGPQETEGAFYVVTARTASKKERRFYRQQTGSTTT